MAQRTGKDGSNALKREVTVTVERRTAASADAVYDVLSDPSTHASWGGVPPKGKVGLVSIEAPAGEAMVGTEWTSTGLDPMGRFADRSVVTQAVRPSLFEFVTEARLTTKKGEVADWTNVNRYELRSDGDGCAIAYTLRVVRISALPGMLRVFNLPGLSALAVKASTRVARHGVERLAAHVEQRADVR
ncbi:MAG: SRPBCC family protein [Actinomycetota bacterium]